MPALERLALSLRAASPAMATTLSTPGCALHALGDVVERARRALERGAFGELHAIEEVALVLDRQEARSARG